MIIKSNSMMDYKKYKNIGNKAKNLLVLNNIGFLVPKFIILDTNFYNYIIQKNDIEKDINYYLSTINNKNIDNISKEIIDLFENIKIDIDEIEGLNEFIDFNKTYAVRSSGFLEDDNDFSFAGLYETALNVKTKQGFEKAILSCYKSMFSNQVINYIWDRKIDIYKLNMSIIIQEMVEPTYSGVAFTVNVLSGNDKEILMEIVQGLGNNLVNGKQNPKLYSYNWYTQECSLNENEEFMDRYWVEILAKEFLNIQKFFGHPCDIEFAVKDDNIYILQARAITKLKYLDIEGQWTTANFKDGGVSAKVCTPLMWSLYEYVWEKTLKSFVLESKLLNKNESSGKLSNMYYGRVYWNLSYVKKAMSRVIGYKERNFDKSLGIDIDYIGDGYTSNITAKSLIRMTNIIFAQKKILENRNKNAELYMEKLLGKYEKYKSIYSDITDEETEKLWYKLTKKDYMQSESIYFWQVFINTVNQPINQYELTKYMSESEYLNALSMIEDVSHLRVFHYIWDVSRKIRANKKAYIYFLKPVEEIKSDLYYKNLEKIKNEKYYKEYYLDKIIEFIDIYGYHSKRELDISYPSYAEDMDTVIQMFKDMVTTDDEDYPFEKNSKQIYEIELKKLKSKVSNSNYIKLKTKLENMRKLLWLREEFKDISTKFYHIIRLYTLKLADYYQRQRIIKKREDIWHLKVADIWNYIDGNIYPDKLRHIIEKNSTYYNSFRNYMSENEIGRFKNENFKVYKKSTDIYGLGCSSGVVTGRARVVKNFEDISKLEKGDILVTEFTDTGWSVKLATVAGIVTQCGGMLCHLSIVAREYGLPCVVAVDELLNRIKDGNIITINGETGEIWIERK